MPPPAGSGPPINAGSGIIDYTTSNVKLSGWTDSKGNRHYLFPSWMNYGDFTRD